MNDTTLFFGDFHSLADVEHEFDLTPGTLAAYHVLVAAYEEADYSGRAWLLLRRYSDGQLFEVNGDHCSCFGLERQFEPEPTTEKAILWRLERLLGGIDCGLLEMMLLELVTTILVGLEAEDGVP